VSTKSPLTEAWRSLLWAALGLLLASVVLNHASRGIAFILGSSYAVTLEMISRKVRAEKPRGAWTLSIGACVVLVVQSYTEFVLGRPWMDYLQGVAFGIGCLVVYGIILPPLFKRFGSPRG
jgi:hypothetical protein